MFIVTTTNSKFVAALCVVLLQATYALYSTTCCQAQHFDISVWVDEEGQLQGSPQVSTGIFEGFFGALSQQNPGFSASNNVFQMGDSLGFNVVEPLLYSVGDGVSAPPGSEYIEINKSSSSIEVRATSEFEEGFILGEVGSFGGIHEHMEYVLLGESDPPTPGVYGLVIEVTSPGYEASDPLLVALAHLDGDFDTLGQIREGVAHLTAYAFPIVGDLNRDGTVNLEDFAILKENFGISDAGWSEGDLTGDGIVGLPDFTELKSNFGSQHSALAELPPAAVPEPTAWALLVCGMFAWLVPRFLAAGSSSNTSATRVNPMLNPSESEVMAMP